MYMLASAVALGFGLMVATPAVAAPDEDCTGACEEGYVWAQANGITTPDACGGKPQEFAAGCLAYLDDTMSAGRGEGDDDD
jgi:hypothetical protein